MPWKGDVSYTRLDPEQKAALRELSHRTRVAQSEIIRMAIARFLVDPPPLGLELLRTGTGAKP